MNKNNTLNYIIFPLKKSLSLLRKLGIDKYIKKLTFRSFLTIMIYAQITESSSLRDLSTTLNSSSQLEEAVGIKSISHSQMSRKLRNINPSYFNDFLNESIKEAHIHLTPNAIKSSLGNLYMIDSSTITMSLTQYRWADYRKTKSGVKLHLRIKFVDEISIPDKAIITKARPADRKQMDHLVVSEKDAINVLDRAYVDYKKFDDYCKNDIFFVTRSKSNSIITVIETNEVSIGSFVISDETVILGNETNLMKSKLRIIKTLDLNNNPISILTNLFDKSAEEIADIYRLRWKIELFFKWLKQHCKVKTFYGKSANAVENQIFIALITYCLLILVKLREGYKGTLLECLRILKSNIFNGYNEFIEKLEKRASKPSVGRRKSNHENNFKKICDDFIKGETTEYMAY
jgi:hypothetical protein